MGSTVLSPFLTELVYSAGAGARLVGVSAYSDYPAEAKRLPSVATAMVTRWFSPSCFQSWVSCWRKAFIRVA